MTLVDDRSRIAGRFLAARRAAAGLILGISEAFIGQYISTAFREMFVYGLVILVLYWKPTGLFNARKTIVKV